MKQPSYLRVLAAGLLCGTLDASAASIQYYSRTGNSPVRVFRYIASALHGSDALAGGWRSAAEGLALHYFIALCFTVFFFSLVHFIPRMIRYAIPCAVLYGCFVWTVMNLGVVPLTQIKPRPFQWDQAAIAAGILILCFGIPLTWLAKKNYIYRKS